MLKGQNYSPEGFANVIECFRGLNKNDQEEFLKLDNRFINSQAINEYLKIKNIVEEIKDDRLQDQNLDLDLMIKIICIHLTNTYGNEFGIKISRFNHSCCPNSYNGDDGIRAISKIKAGQEITATYQTNLGMKNLATRREHLETGYGFTCCCDLCKEEEINIDQSTYDTFDQLQVMKVFSKKLVLPNTSVYYIIIFVLTHFRRNLMWE